MSTKTAFDEPRTRTRVALKISLAVNLLLLALFWHQVKTLRPAATTPLEADPTITAPVTVYAQEGPNDAASQSRTEPVAARCFDWSQLEAPDYRAYIVNLRSVRCPERTVREIIMADVADMYSPEAARIGTG